MQTLQAMPSNQDQEVSDHVQIRNNKFTLQGRISETVLKLNPDMIKNAGINGNRRMLMLEYLNQLMDSRQPFLLVTELKIMTTLC